MCDTAQSRSEYQGHANFSERRLGEVVLRINLPFSWVNEEYVSRGEMTEGCLPPIGPLCCALVGKEGRGQEARPAVLGTSWDEWSQWRNRLPPKWGGGGARRNK